MFTCRHAPYAVSPELARILVEHYSEPHRAYHNLAHIAELLRWFDLVADAVGWELPRDVYDTILFHDAIYDPRASDNEQRSAELAAAYGASDFTRALIELTAQHPRLTDKDLLRNVALASRRDATHFLDCDLAILGAEPAAFDAYDAAIAIEYAHVPPAAYRMGRGVILRALRERPRLYFSSYFHDQLDAAARANLDRALARY